MSGALIGGVIGAAIGFFAGGNVALGWMIGSAIGGAYDYSQIPDTIGPRLQDRTMQQSSYGAQIPLAFGSVRLAGNVIWPADFNVEEHESSESSKGGPETVTFSYTANFAILLCEGPIEGIGRIWMNKKLVYDPSSATATTDPAIVGMTVYLGTETQEPDPLMVATDGSAPAYRGWAYIVFEDLELTSSGFGNRLPNIEVEVFSETVVSGPPAPRVVELGASAAIGASAQGLAIVDPVTGFIWSHTPSFLDPTVEVRVNDDDTQTQRASFSPFLTSAITTDICYVPPTREIWVTGETFGTWFDRFVIFAGNPPTYVATATGLYHGTDDIKQLAYNPTTGKLMGVRQSGNVSLINPLSRDVSSLSDFYMGATAGSLGTITGQEVIVTPTYFCVFVYGTVDAVVIRHLSDYSFYGQVSTISTGTASMFYDPDRDRLIVSNNGARSYQVIDIATLTSSTQTYTTAVGADTVPPPSPAGSTKAATYAGEKYIFGGDGSAGTGSTLYVVNPDTYASEYTYTYETYVATQLMAHPLLVPKDITKNYVFSFDRDSVKRLYFKGTIGGDAVTLASIVSALSTRVPFGLDTADIDVTALTDLVDGYLVGQQMTRRQAIEPLQAAYFFDAVESDHKIKYVKRGSASVVTIAQDDRAAHLDGEEMPPHLEIQRISELELPWAIDVSYTEKARDYQVGTQYDRRITRNANDPRRLEMAIVMTAAKAKQVALVNLYLPWLRTRFGFSTTLAYAKYEPSDVVTLPTDNVTYTARLTARSDQGNGVIRWEAELEDSAIYTQTGTVSTTTFVPQTIRDPGTTNLELLDMPILRDADDNPGYYVAMGGSVTTWPGAQLFKSTDNGASYTAMLSIVNTATIGTASGVLGNFTAGNIFDEGNSVTVVLTSGGPLTSATADQVLNGSNTAVIGAHGRWEVINFKTATLTGTNTYLLSGFLRGRRGTEWATGTHAAGDTFVIASTSTWQRPNPGSAEIGLARLYKAPPFGTQLSAATAESFTNSAVGLEPYAPVNLAGTRDGSGNLTITWKRRSRIGYGGLHTIVPLGETTESYSTDIMNGSTVVRTIASATQAAAYTSAMQITDWGANQAAVTVNVYQISATVARGYALNGTV